MDVFLYYEINSPMDLQDLLWKRNVDKQKEGRGAEFKIFELLKIFTTLH